MKNRFLSPWLRRVARPGASVLFSAFLALSALVVSSSAASAATVRVHYDTGWGSSISIRGDAASLSWFSGQGASWSPGNVWVHQTPVSDGGFEFKPLINDSTWSVGSNYVVPSGTSTVDIYPFFGGQNGTLVTVSDLYSQTLGNSRDLTIYLPPSYHENTAKYYPVLYMHDGQNLFDASSAFGGTEWEVDETIDELVRQGDMREVVVVGIDNNADRISEYTPMPDPDYGGGNGDAYLDFVQDEVMPYIESSYRVLTGRENTYIGGSSLGGLISFYAAWTRSETFGHAVCMSSSFWWNDEALTDDVLAHTGPLHPHGQTVVYMDAGGTGDGADNTAEMRDALHGIGYTFELDLFHWFDPPGSHNEASWARRFDVPMRKLLPW